MKRIFIGICLILMASDALAINWPLKISASGNYLEDQAGAPFLVIGDSAWDLMVGDGMNNANVQTYLDDRQAKGFTAILVEVIEHAFSGPYDYNSNYPFTNGENDWSLRDANYWANVDYVLTQAKNRNMVVFLFPAFLGYTCGSEGWCSHMTYQSDSAMANYGTWLASRYSSQGNVIWVHGGDTAAASYENALSRVNSIANAIVSGIAGSLHSGNSYRERSSLDDYNQPWLNINATYSNCTTYAGRIQTDYERDGALPFTMIEGKYENGSGWSMLCIQGQALGSYLGGALLGHFYGNETIWPFTTGWDGSSGIGSSGSVSMGYIGKLMKSRQWWTMEPDYTNVVVTSSKGSGLTYHSTARETTGRTVMVWCPDTSQVTVDMTKISGSQAKVWWWNPNDNSSSLIGTYNTTGSQNFTPALAGIVLVLDDIAYNYPAPGTFSLLGQGMVMQGGTIK